MMSLVLAASCLAQCPAGPCPPGVCSPCGDVVWNAPQAVRFVSNSPCVPTGYGGSDVIAQLAAQQERLGAQIRSMSEDLATIRWQFARPVQRAAPLAAPEKMMPSPQPYASPQASPQVMTPYEVPPPPARKSPPLPAPQMPPSSMPPPQADAALQWQRALQAHRIKVRYDGSPAPIRDVEGADRMPYELD